jgi:hypothetical protein
MLTTTRGSRPTRWGPARGMDCSCRSWEGCSCPRLANRPGRAANIWSTRRSSAAETQDRTGGAKTRCEPLPVGSANALSGRRRVGDRYGAGESRLRLAAVTGHSSAATPVVGRRRCCEASLLPANAVESRRLPGSATCSRAFRRTPLPGSVNCCLTIGSPSLLPAGPERHAYHTSRATGTAVYECLRDAYTELRSRLSKDVLERELDHARINARIHNLPEIRRRNVG